MKLQDMSNEELLFNIKNKTEILSMPYKAELLSRLERDEGERDAIKWANIAGAHQQQIGKLADEIENLKCCGNCSMQKCEMERGNLNYNFGIYCHRWQSDNMTRKEREG